MDVLIQFDEKGMYQNNPWDIPVPYQKGEVHLVSPLSAMVLIDQAQAHLYLNDEDRRMTLLEK
ncbi:hypothetical protein OH458_08445 [Vibrio sp. MarTm2]|uniref:Uncharacterized protein n=2 Tax=Vibrio TaxID=662 RepID=A0ABR4YFH1_9VIBR|nr:MULTISPECIES: hypothetical protein [Vibrio]EED28691.1 hypothetical protein VPMS16_243 [Vibrio sp. 16]KHA62015.1 hypothetical protein NL53_01665 [Vibrio variabilis]KHD26044.1 hypothetical protein NM09_04680 [Vibrio caribbeanicus]KHT46687.1 hypothetical protein RJ47_04725 [Vibrio sinaloensis]KHT50484.1 hypothetical protein RJ46_06330 [Vibrio sinaloensis]